MPAITANAETELRMVVIVCLLARDPNTGRLTVSRPGRGQSFNW
jgi:hypothetical protein